MFKLLPFLVVFSIFFIPNVKAESSTSEKSVFDFVAPLVYEQSDLPGRPVGLIFYDLSKKALTVIDELGKPKQISGEGSVVTTDGTNEQLVRLAINAACTSHPCTISSQSGVLPDEVSFNGTGNYTIKFTNEFATAPTCVTTNFSSLGFMKIQSISTTEVNILTFNTSSVATNLGFHLFCMGKSS